jgi:hypothetical protein
MAEAAIVKTVAATCGVERTHKSGESYMRMCSLSVGLPDVANVTKFQFTVSAQQNGGIHVIGDGTDLMRPRNQAGAWTRLLHLSRDESSITAHFTYWIHNQDATATFVVDFQPPAVVFVDRVKLLESREVLWISGDYTVRANAVIHAV